MENQQMLRGSFQLQTSWFLVKMFLESEFEGEAQLLEMIPEVTQIILMIRFP